MNPARFLDEPRDPHGWCPECDSVHELRGPCPRRVDGWIVAIAVAAMLVVVGFLIGRWL